MIAYLCDFASVCWAMRWHLLALALVTMVVARVVTTIEARDDD